MLCVPIGGLSAFPFAAGFGLCDAVPGSSAARSSPPSVERRSIAREHQFVSRALCQSEREKGPPCVASAAVPRLLASWLSGGVRCSALQQSLLKLRILPGRRAADQHVYTYCVLFEYSCGVRSRIPARSTHSRTGLV